MLCLIVGLAGGSFVSCSATSEEEYSQFLEFQAELVDSVLVSSAFPKGRISFDDDLKYIGGETFILYKVARCEIHLFATLDSVGGYERIFWIQYEGYLPSNFLPFPANLKPGGLKYDYSNDPIRDTISGKEFAIRTGLFNINFTDEELTRKIQSEDSDFTRVAQLLYRNQININSDVLSVRMVHLNEERNEELMIIYYEPADMKDGKIIGLEGKGKDSPNWAIVSKDLLSRVKEKISITFE